MSVTNHLLEEFSRTAPQVRKLSSRTVPQPCSRTVRSAAGAAVSTAGVGVAVFEGGSVAEGALDGSEVLGVGADATGEGEIEATLAFEAGSWLPHTHQVVAKQSA